MAGFEDATSYIPGLAHTFEQNLRSRAGTAVRGWGQFISAEAHHDQIGPYGTSAGVLVRSLAGTTNPIDPGVTGYVTEVWAQHDGNNRKYFVQNIRLAFMILGLSHLRHTEHDLIAIRDAAAAELRNRQKPDGSWGDWHDPNGNVPAARIEPTTWCAFALSEAGGTANKASASRGAAYLQTLALAIPSVDRNFDPFAIAVICAVSRPKKIDHGIARAARRMLAEAANEDPLRIVIYFFDYLDEAGSVKRDYLCVPSIFVASVLASSVSGLHVGTLSWVFAAKDSWKVYLALKAATTGPFFKPRQTSYAATVDQALVALGATYVAGIQSGLASTLPVLVPAVNFLRKWIVTRLMFPAALLMMLVALATNPQAVGDLWVVAFKAPNPQTQAFFTSLAGPSQIISAFLLATIGQSLVSSIAGWIKLKIWGDR